MRIIHASDLHLGRPLRGLPLHGQLEIEAFRHCAFRTLTRLVDLALEQHVDLIIVAGDLIEESVRNYKVGLRLIHEFSRLEQQGTQVAWVRGNHDAENRVIANLLRPAHIHELGLSGAQTLHLDHLGVALVGRSFTHRACFEDLLATYPPKHGSLCTIGLLHTSGDGAITGDRYAPCRRSDLVAKSYDYLALGHVHQHSVVSRTVPVAYSGCLQGRSFLESGPRGCLLLQFDDGKLLHMEHRSLETVRFGIIPIDASRATSFEQVLEAILLGAERATRQHPERALVARFRIVGEGVTQTILRTSTQLRERSLASLIHEMPTRLAPDGFWCDPGMDEAPPVALASVASERIEVE